LSQNRTPEGACTARNYWSARRLPTYLLCHPALPSFEQSQVGGLMAAFSFLASVWPTAETAPQNGATIDLFDIYKSFFKSHSWPRRYRIVWKRHDQSIGHQNHESDWTAGLKSEFMSWNQQVFGPSFPMAEATFIALGTYLIGCLATGYYLVRTRLGRDVRELWSGNVGAKNVGRVLGPAGFVITLAGDGVKGTVAVWLVWHFTLDGRMAALAMLGVVMGHIWPLQLGFRGGKGMATSLGALLWFDFRLTMASLALLLCLLCLLRRSVVSGLIAFALIPLMAMMLGREAWEVVALSVLSGMVLIAHRRNLIEEVAQMAGRREDEPKPDESFK
jgi:acyl phosphate:glycerol-3-phosphate acyltransferase